MYDLALQAQREITLEAQREITLEQKRQDEINHAKEQMEAWKLKMDNLSLTKTTHGNPDGDDSSSSSSNSDRSRKFSRRSNKKKQSDRKKKKKKNKKYHSYASSSSSSSSSEDEDKEYRSIVNTLSKNSKYYKIKELQLHSNPTIRREKFNVWVIDFKNILSTHKSTAKNLEGYPAKLPLLPLIVDQALKTILSSITAGMVKRIVSS